MDDDVTGTGYPVGWEADAVLRDGTTTHIRPIRPSDAPALQAFHVAQSERSTYLRFFAAMAKLPERDLVRFTTVDHVDRVALVALRTVDDTEHIIGVARYDKIGPDVAEVAFNIADTQQGRGIGSVLLEHVAAAARERGVRRFTAEVLPQNGRMLAVFRDAGYDVSQHVDDGIVTVTVELDPTERSRSVVAERERRAEARSVSALLEARSVVVLVGDEEHEAAAARVLASLAPLAAAGEDVHVVAPRASGLQVPAGARGHHELEEVTGPVDLAVVALAPDELLEVVPDLARLGVRGLVVVNEGYAETGAAGLDRQRRLLRAAHLAGMRVVGPGSYGLARAGADGPLTATLGPVPLAGSIGVFCQSAPTAVTLLATLQRRGLGLSMFLSAGNRADVSGNDLMQFWQEDTATTVACLYLESIGNPRKFSRLARRLAAVKPVVVVTAGRSGQVVPPGHVVRATQAPRGTLEEMMRQAGVIRAENTHQMIDIAQLLDTQPLPAGARVAVVASSPALAALVAEAAASAGLDVVPATGVVPEGWADADVRAAVDSVYALADVDAVVAVHIPVLGPGSTSFVRAVAHAAARTGRPTVASVLGRHGLVPDLATTTAAGDPWQVPAYATPEDAVLALAAVVRYAQWRARGHGTYVAPEVADDAHERAEALAATGPRTLEAHEVAELLAGYGITLVPSRVVTDADEAVAAAEELGWPVVVKSTAASLRHRADLGGIRLDITSADAVRDHFAQMEDLMVRQFGTTMPFEVQHQVPSGVACVLRSEEDPLFGPVVSFGLAGDAVDLLDDVSYGIPPLTDTDVHAMVRGVRASPRLFGYRGLPPMDVAGLEDIVERVSRMADTLPVLRTLELNPVVVTPTGVHVLGARCEMAPASRSGDDRRALPW